ncbi:hypothetical protein [Pseudomonas kilonensis]|uniref:hypothetical protein n=1 Tax=Pseudomonas kilonensis TaxID=132476 RepID=UPI00069E5CF8|nr:hypothetical protein [Pseudomonas kilonensis]
MTPGALKLFLTGGLALLLVSMGAGFGAWLAAGHYRPLEVPAQVPCKTEEVAVPDWVAFKSGTVPVLCRSCEIAEVRFATWPHEAPAFWPLYDARI